MGSNGPPQLTVRALRREIELAEERIRPYVVETPIELSHSLSRRGDAEVFLKHEQVQHTGSFKFRGATNKILSLSRPERVRGVVAASTGNHGIAVAEALATLGAQGTVFLPKVAAAAKIAGIRARGAEVRIVGEDCVEAELAARAFAVEQDRPFISPYNDPQVVAGQGTVGVELARRPGRLDAVFIAVGGGGLISGCAAWLSKRRNGPRIIGAQPKRSDVMRRSIEAGCIVDVPSGETLSDGTAGGIEPGALTFPLCHQLIDEMVLVTELEIARAMRLLVDEHHVLVEGAAAVPVAAYLKVRRRFRGQRIGLVLCGRNVSGEVVRTVLQSRPGGPGRS